VHIDRAMKKDITIDTTAALAILFITFFSALALGIIGMKLNAPDTISNHDVHQVIWMDKHLTLKGVDRMTKKELVNAYLDNARINGVK
tara:strand:+ start:1394 stop:1657 length:264 start_codon:yes stop_codon:yes gene_type:complete